MKNIFLKTILFFLIYTAGSVTAQTIYADKKTYLIDSLDRNTLSKADNHVLDSCIRDYHRATEDTIRLKQLGYLADQITDNRTWFCYAKLFLSETKACLGKKGNSPAVTKRLHALAGAAYNFLGYYFHTIETKDSTSAYNYLLSIHEYNVSGETKKSAKEMNNLAISYTTMGKVKEAMKCYQDGLRILEVEKDTAGIAKAYQSIGNLLRNQDDITGAQNYFKKSLSLFTKMGDRWNVAVTLNFIGICQKVNKNYDSALTCYDASLAIYDSLHDDYGRASELLNKGVIYQEKGDLVPALNNYQKSLELFEKTGDKNGISFAVNSLAIIYYKKGDFAAALKAGERDMELAKEMDYPENIMNAAQILSSVYKSTGKYREALEMNELFTKMNDSILNADTKRDAIERDIKYEHDKELLGIKKEREKEVLAAQKEKEKRNIIIIAISVGMILLMIFFLFLYNRFRFIRQQKNIIELQKTEVEQQKDIIETKNHEIVDSIMYAKRLQQAILPQKKLIAEYLTDSFVMYKPKDIVAGDFYWIEKVGDDVIIAAADCTGHGVPGAMVSFVCVNALNRSVLEFGLKEPAAILDKVSQLVVEAFRRSEDQVKDGMDISLCVLNTKTHALSYAGAYNPLWILKKNDPEISEFGATRQAIGNVLNPKPFINNNISLTAGDSFFLFSDGFADQFGGPKGKKLKHSHFKKILLELRALPMNELEKKLDNTFEDWKGGLEQVDDICVIGIRIPE